MQPLFESGAESNIYVLSPCPSLRTVKLCEVLSEKIWKIIFRGIGVEFRKVFERNEF